VLTQTCDVIRAATDRPELEVSPLVKVSSEHLQEIKKGYRPRYAYVPAVESIERDIVRSEFGPKYLPQPSTARD